MNLLLKVTSIIISLMLLILLNELLVLHVKTLYNVSPHLPVSHIINSSYSNLLVYYSRITLFLFLETSIMVVTFVLLAFILWHSVPLSQFRKITKELTQDINYPIDKQLSYPYLADDSSKIIQSLQNKIRDLITKRTKMLATISHDLRTPLTRLRMRIEMLETEQESSNEMLADIDEMSAMIKETLDFSRDDVYRGEKQVINLHVMLITLYNDFRLLGYNIHYQPYITQVNVLAYPVALKRVFNNILENAIHFSDTVVLTLTHVDNKRAIVNINDRGPGISEEKIEAVFNAYSRADSLKPLGSGLGLNIAHEIVTLHGGSITLHNRKNGGLNVCVVLPIDDNHK